MEQPDDWTAPGAYEVASGVYRMPLPLPTDGLRAVNVYALVTDDDLVLVDGGWALAESRTQLDAALAGLGREVRDISRFLVTHAHRDHYTQAVAIRREFGTPVGLGEGEKPTLEVLNSPDRMRLPQLDQLDRHGAASVAASIRGHLPADPPPVDDWAMPDDWLAAGPLPVSGRVLETVPTPGHTRGHVVFADRSAQLLFAGDHVLPHITPSIGFEAVPVDYPLRDYLDSLRLVRDMPDLRLLPAHGPVTASVHTRVDELLAHHAARLDACLAAIGSEGTAYDAAQVLPWTRREKKLADLDVFNQMLAICETAAHLDLLYDQGALTRTEVDGVTRYATR